MRSHADTAYLQADFIGAIVLALLTGALVLTPGIALSETILILFFLPIPGYTLVAALFPEQEAKVEAPTPTVSMGLLERAILSIVVAIALIVFAGIIINASPWLITLRSTVLTLCLSTCLTAVVGVYRRNRLPVAQRFSPKVLGWRGVQFRQAASVQTVAVCIAILLVAGSLTAINVSAGSNEQFSELSLLTEADNGQMSMSDYPQNLTEGEQTPLVVALGNHEGKPVTYSVVVKLEQVGPAGSVQRQSELFRANRSIPDGERVSISHTVEPTFSGEELRLTYLLYRGQPPSNPSITNAYREAHIWVSVR